jgi:hypothetical protein
MKEQYSKPKNNELYNNAVRHAYYKILKKAKHLLSTIEQDELRFTLERQDNKKEVVGIIVHELVNPVLYLRLEHHTDNIMAIHFGIEQINQIGQLSSITTTFLRLLYSYTSKEMTAINIENAIRTDWFINSCSAAYEYIEERNKHHVFKLIPFKPSKLKLMMSIS